MRAKLVEIVFLYNCKIIKIYSCSRYNKPNITATKKLGSPVQKSIDNITINVIILFEYNIKISCYLINNTINIFCNYFILIISN